MPQYLTFDCYDTLVQYSASKKACIEALTARQSMSIDANAVVRTQERLERELQKGSFMTLSEILSRSLKQAFDKFGLDYKRSLGMLLENNVRFAPCFPETRWVLRNLARSYRLVIISNSESKIIKDNIAVIGVPFFQVITAADAKCYKPDPDIFQLVLKRLDCNETDLIHIAAGFYHDIRPCAELGWERIWINRSRRSGDQSLGPYTELQSLEGLLKHLPN